MNLKVTPPGPQKETTFPKKMSPNRLWAALSALLGPLGIQSGAQTATMTKIPLNLLRKLSKIDVEI